MLLSKVPGVGSYTGKDVGFARSLSAADVPGPAFHAYALDSVDLDRAIPKIQKLSCMDTFDRLELKFPGQSKPVQCPSGCNGIGKLAGTSIYSPDSTVCRAALHAGILGSDGGKAVVTRRHGQDQLFSSRSGGEQSSDSPAVPRSFTLSLPTAGYLSRAKIQNFGVNFF